MKYKGKLIWLVIIVAILILCAVWGDTNYVPLTSGIPIPTPEYTVIGSLSNAPPMIVTNTIVKYLPPSNTVIRVYFKNKLTDEPLYHMEFVTPRMVAFAGWEVIEE